MITGVEPLTSSRTCDVEIPSASKSTAKSLPRPTPELAVGGRQNVATPNLATKRNSRTEARSPMDSPRSDHKTHAAKT